MRFVIYDDESLEPITVLNLPLTERDALKQRVWWVPVPPPLMQMSDGPPENPDEFVRIQTVDIEFEPLVRNTRRNGEQRSVIAFTRAADLAMLLNPAWLPGQRGAVDYLTEQNDALTRMLMRVF